MFFFFSFRTKVTEVVGSEENTVSVKNKKMTSIMSSMLNKLFSESCLFSD